MKAVALALVLTTACFPHNPKARTYAKAGEGAALAAGIGILYFANSGADCDEMRSIGDETSSSCRANANVLTAIGLGLILGGLGGFIATVSTSPEDKAEPPANTLAPTPITTNHATGRSVARPANHGR
jgi:hypothetical protein